MRHLLGGNAGRRTRARLDYEMTQSSTVMKIKNVALVSQDHPESLKAAYDRYFRVVRAESPDQREEAFRLRYQVYCVENDYEPICENPGERETDELFVF